MPRPVRDVHASGFHGATEEQWAALAETVAKRATVAGITEANNAVTPDGWKAYRPHDIAGSECVVTWDRAVWAQVQPECDNHGSWRLTKRTFYTGKGNERPGVVATWVLLRQESSSKTLLRIVAHMPASVQRGDGFSTNLRRVRAWRSALLGLHRMVLQLTASHQPSEVVVSCDWNVDLSRKAWRLLVNSALGGTHLRLKPATEGTHGVRVIDAHATTLAAPARHVLGHHEGFDHRPVLVRLNTRRTP